jgi:drug/metabolite transporter (DMT)-like permease
MSPLVLREKVSLHSWIAICVGFIGILIVLRPTPDHFHLAQLAALCVALSIATLSVTARLLSTTESGVALNFYIYPANVLISAYWAIDTWVTPTAFDWFLFITLGTCATAALGCFVQSLRYAMPAVVSPIDYARMLWMISIGYVIWGEVPTPITWVGIIIIIASGIYVVSHGKKIPELEMAKETKTGAL